MKEIFKKIKKAATNEKIRLIGENKGDKIFKEVLLHTYDRINLNFYVKKWPAVTRSGSLSISNKDDFKVLKVVLKQLSDRQVTGGAAIELVVSTLSSFDKDSQDIIEKILKRDLKCGFSEGSINKAIPGLIPSFDVVLAKNYADHEKKVTYTDNWVVSRKLDGVRCIAIKGNGTFRFYSRQGKEFTTLDNLIPYLLELTDGHDDAVFDGEVCIVEGDVENFTNTMKEIKKKNHTIDCPKYYIFDYLMESEFFAKQGESTFFHRQELLEDLFEVNVDDRGDFTMNVEQLEQQILTEEVFSSMQIQVADEGWEGLILRKADEVYKGRRTDHLLKVKKFFDDEYTVLETLDGDYAYQEKGLGQKSEVMMTAVVIEHKGQRVQVGSGWSIEQRRAFYDNPSQIIGKEITVQYFEETTNKRGTISLRFPTVKCIHGDKREV